jgi:hypothetical protein
VWIGKCELNSKAVVKTWIGLTVKTFKRPKAVWELDEQILKRWVCNV